jgi:hypothetical protein
MIENLLNQSHNKYNKDTICMKNYKKSVFSRRVKSLVFFHLETAQKITQKSRLYMLLYI